MPICNFELKQRFKSSNCNYIKALTTYISELQKPIDMNELCKSEQAGQIFQNSYNCSQSVLSVFSKELGLSNDLALKLASPFGAGICRTQQTCGAVTGALMAIGLKHGKGEHGTDDDKAKAYALSNRFMDTFQEKFGTTTCLVLLDGLTFSEPDDVKIIEAKDMFNIRCRKYVEEAVKIVEPLL
jgi:C_GCAxxG_C_C family probable redox protein